MHYLDPARPRISGLPACRLDTNPAGLSIIPGLHCAPREGGQIEISGFFSTGRNTSARRTIMIATADFASFWDRWLSDPEAVAEHEFGWRPLTPATTPVLTLDDLLEDL